MAEGILGLGSGQASALNSDLIEKLKQQKENLLLSLMKQN